MSRTESRPGLSDGHPVGDELAAILDEMSASEPTEEIDPVQAMALRARLADRD